MILKSSTNEQNRIITASLLFLAAVALAATLSYTKAVMIPFVFAIFLTYIVSPIVDFLQLRLRLPRLLSVIVALVVLGAMLYVVGSLLVYSARSMLANLDLYQERLIAMVKKTAEFLEQFNLNVQYKELMNQLREAIRGAPIADWLQGTAGQAINIITKSTLVLIFVVFLLIGRNPHRVQSGIYGEIDTQIRKYLIVKLGVSAATGFLVGLILYLMNLDLALVFGVLTFVLNFIPSLGSIVATLLPIPIAFIQYDSLWPVLLVFLLPGGVQMFIGNFVDPKILGQRLDLHPVVVILSLVFWGLLWGPIGMLLAVPITAVARIVLARIETTRPIAELLVGHLPSDTGGEGPSASTQSGSQESDDLTSPPPSTD